MNSCFFIGHREANEGLLPRLELESDRLVAEENVRYFYVGRYGGFDQIVATAVKRAKKRHPDITLCRIILQSGLSKSHLVMMEHIIRKA